jgi:spermidine/putrescine transport system permease protein
MKTKYVSIPYVIWMLIFIFAPLCLVVYFAFTDGRGNFTLDNLGALANYGPVFLHSIVIAIISTAVCLIIAYPVSYMLSRMKAYRQKIMLMIIILPMWMNFLLRTYALMGLLEKNGLINKFFALFGLGPFTMINTNGAVILGMVYNYIPFMIMPLYSTMVKIDQSLIEAAQDLGGNVWDVLSKVLMPLSMPGITTGITMVFVPSCSTFAISRMLGGDAVYMIGDLIDLQFFGNRYNPNLGSAMSLVLMVLVLLCMSVTNGFADEDTEVTI